MQNPYEANHDPEERSSRGLGCGCLAALGLALVLVVCVLGGVVLYRMQVRAAAMQEQAIRVRLEAERAKAEAVRARLEAQQVQRDGLEGTQAKEAEGSPQ